MAKINEYPQAVTINNNDLFVIDQESGGDHATKSASVSQIADKATSGVQSQIGNLSSLTTTDKSSIVGAVNEIVGGALRIATFSFSKTINATTQAGYTVLRTDFNLPSGAKAISAFLREYSSSTVNAGGLIYSAQVNSTNNTCIEGQLYNGTNSSRTYYITATVFYTLA